MSPGSQNIEKKREGQTLLEYVIVIGIVTLILVAMTPDMKRAIQALVKVTADQLAPQEESEQSTDPEEGYLVESRTKSGGQTRKWIDYFTDYEDRFEYDDYSYSSTTSNIYLGYVNKTIHY